ncbi:lipoate--protein ligase family protein [Photobacterium sanguinicancri]|uniref:Lipoate--protein ligase n=1 Tax=Photobacterium sanguinicancri TaxID=875932 RepID=A0ABX4G3F3_9GAMM|nr:lipoate--protein ligase [Photobacterium sanguinicancri]OZS45496.1 lipoate--protein ligase [Photobacterium sanguinicancri]
MKLTNKLVRYPHIDVARAFEKEDALLQQIQAGDIAQALLLWQAKSPTLVLPAGNKWPVTEQSKQLLAAQGWQLTSRKTGGAPVPQLPGIINLSHIYHWPSKEPYNIQKAYLQLCHVLALFFKGLGVDVDIHATPGSYCDGDYNLNINKQKVVGTAQRVLLKKGGGQIVLSQACILLDVDLEDIVAPVNFYNQVCGNSTVIDAQVHTPLYAHLTTLPSVDSLFQQLSQAFIKHA